MVQNKIPARLPKSEEGNGVQFSKRHDEKTGQKKKINV